MSLLHELASNSQRMPWCLSVLYFVKERASKNNMQVIQVSFHEALWSYFRMGLFQNLHSALRSNTALNIIEHKRQNVQSAIIAKEKGKKHTDKSRPPHRNLLHSTLTWINQKNQIKPNDFTIILVAIVIITGKDLESFMCWHECHVLVEGDAMIVY